jgi:hypothetical protein
MKATVNLLSNWQKSMVKPLCKPACAKDRSVHLGGVAPVESHPNFREQQHVNYWAIAQFQAIQPERKVQTNFASG